MAWTATISYTTEKSTIGTATATWNKGEVDEFSFSGRVDNDDLSKFISAAQAALAAHQTAAQTQATFINKIESALNG